MKTDNRENHSRNAIVSSMTSVILGGLFLLADCGSSIQAQTGTFSANETWSVNIAEDNDQTPSFSKTNNVKVIYMESALSELVAGSKTSLPNKFEFNFKGRPKQVVIVETSTNLVNWEPLQTNTLTVTSTGFTDKQWTNYPARFHRVESRQIAKLAFRRRDAIEI